MCGIFGGIGRPDANILRGLAYANRERGKDSLGFFKSNGQLMKRKGDAERTLPEFSRFLEDRKAWFIVGHTRYATQGKVTQRNAHPFRRGRIVGVHNGVVDAPNNYKVDSEYLIDRLSQHDYQKALQDVSGYWSLCWFNGADLYIACHKNQVAITRTKDSIYFSSDESHLEAITGLEATILRSPRVIRFDVKLARRLQWHDCPDFVSKAHRRIAYDPRTSGVEYTCTNGKWEPVDDVEYLKEDWQEAEYLAHRSGFTSVDDAMSYLGVYDPVELVEYLEGEHERLWDDESIRTKGQWPA